MKLKIVKFNMVLLLFAFINAGCQKDKFEYADENIVVSNFPGISVYKTNSNYIDFVSVQELPDGQLNRIPDYTLEYFQTYKEETGKDWKFRWQLKNGYVVDGSTGVKNLFTDITIREYAEYNSANNTAIWPIDSIKSRIIDRDPFVEYYHMGCINCEIKEFTLREINDMLENGTIEEHFEKIK